MKYGTFILLVLTLLSTCGPAEDDAGPEPSETFDRQAMLASWANDVIEPAFAELARSSSALDQQAVAFAEEATAEKLTSLREAYLATYSSWQRAAPFTVGIASELRLTEQINIYPTDTQRLATGEVYDYALPSNIDVQGLPALDYLLYGVDTPSEYRRTIVALTSRLEELTTAVADHWADADTRQTYLENSGNSATASVDRTVNDYIFWYEKHLRAGKVGIPAGVFSSAPNADLVEVPYGGGNREMLLEGIDVARAFFVHEPGLKSYLDALDVRREGELLSNRIVANFDRARVQAEQLNASLGEQVTEDNRAMLQTYDALQANVILLKVDMLQALGINVDYVDADGD